jgi:hypothetical protein
MNPKIANLIAVELGILIGLMSWLVYSRLPSVEPGTATEMKRRMVNSIPPDAPAINPRDQDPKAVDYRERAQIAHEAQVAREQQYYREIAPQRYANSRLGNGYITVDSPSYAIVDQEPAAVPGDYAASPQTIVYTQPTQFIAYAEPIQTVVLSDSRRFANRCRPAPRACAPQTITRPSLGTLSSGPSGNRVLSAGPSGNVLSRATAIAPSCPPTAGFRPRGHR